MASVEVFAEPEGTVELVLQLNAADARRFDGVVEERLLSQIALVMFGKVLSAPVLENTEFNGRISVPGLERELANRIAASLAA